MKNRIISLIFSAILIGLVVIGITFLFLITPSPDLDINYNDFNFDYIIPMPGVYQVFDIAQMEFIDSIVPYYLYRTNLESGTNNVFNLYLLDRSDEGSFDIFSDINLNNANTIVINSELFELSNCQIGSDMVFNFFGKTVHKNVQDILSIYPFSSNNVAFTLLSDEFHEELKNKISQLSWSGAFVKVNDFQKADRYFYYDYRPLGKVGDESWYESPEAYEFMLNSISNTAVPNEIINLHTKRIEQESLQSVFIRSRLINACISYALISMWIILSSLVVLICRNKRDLEILKLGYQVKKIKNGYRIYNFIIWLLSSLMFPVFFHKYNIFYSIIYEFCICVSVLISWIIMTHRFSKLVSSLAVENFHASDNGSRFDFTSSKIQNPKSEKAIISKNNDFDINSEEQHKELSNNIDKENKTNLSDKILDQKSTETILPEKNNHDMHLGKHDNELSNNEKEEENGK